MIRRFLLLWIVFAVLTAAVPAEAAYWEKIAVSKAGSFYIDTESIADGPDGSKEVRQRLVYDQPDCASAYAQGLKKCIVESVYHDRYFSNKTFCSLGGEAHFADGTSRTYSYVGKVRTISPGSVADIIWNHLFR